VGITALFRPSTLLLIPFILPWIFFAAGTNSVAARRLSWRSLRTAMIFLACCLLPLAPAAGRNYLRGQDFNLVTFAGGPGFLLGNGPGANGTLNIEALRSVGVQTADPENMFRVLAGIVDDARGRKARPSEISNYCYRAAFQTIAASPGAYLKLLLRKFLLFVNSLEIGSNYDYYLARDNSFALRLGFLNLGLIFPLAFLGMILGWKQRRKLYLLYVFTGQFFVFALLFYVISRYRFPILPFLLLFAAFGVWEMIGFLRRGQRGRFLLFSGLLVPMYLLVNRDPDLGRFFNPYYNLGAAYTVRKQYQPALDAYREALKVSPSDYRIYYNLGNIHYDLGEWDQSVQNFRQALRINPGFSLARHNLASALARSHRYTEAITEYRHLLRSNSEDPEIYYNLSLIYRNLGEDEAAEAHYRQYWELEFQDR
jgi:tetratricopeptide (TPR) repeat protein